MSAPAERKSRLFDGVHRGRLLAGFCLTAILSLSVHAVMIDILHVPYPSHAVAASFPFRLLTNLAVACGAVWLYGALRKGFPHRGWVFSAIVLFLLICGLNEALRGWFMNTYCNEPFLKSAVFLGLVALAGTLFHAATVALSALGWRFMQKAWQKAVGILLFGFLLTAAVSPLVSLAQQATADHFQYLAILNGWCTMPYGLNVLIPAYATFVEPALACLICAAFSWKYLPGGFGTKVLTFTLLILALKQKLFAAFIYAFYAQLPFWTALGSMGQFSLEAAALGLLTALTWAWATAPHPER